MLAINVAQPPLKEWEMVCDRVYLYIMLSEKQKHKKEKSCYKTHKHPSAFTLASYILGLTYN